MLKRINLAAILVLVCALTVSAFQNADWIKVAPVGAGFSVLMPGKPEEEVKSAPDFTLHLFSIMAEKTIYIAGYGDYAPSIKLAPDGELAARSLMVRQARHQGQIKGLVAEPVEGGPPSRPLR